VLVDRPDHRDDDRGEEDEEAPEDRRVDQPRDESLEQLALAEHDHRLVLDAPGHVIEALDRLAEPDERDEQARPAGEQGAADGEQRGERERSGRDVYDARAFPRPAVAAGAFPCPAIADRAFRRQAIMTAPSGARR
jgi:hypothetical protein